MWDIQLDKKERSVIQKKASQERKINKEKLMFPIKVTDCKNDLWNFLDITIFHDITFCAFHLGFPLSCIFQTFLCFSVACNLGTYYNDSMDTPGCAPCPDGYYRGSVEEASCMMCPSGKAPSADKTTCSCKNYFYATLVKFEQKILHCYFIIQILFSHHSST